MARSYGCYAIAQPLTEVYGIPSRNASFAGVGVSGFVEWNYTYVTSLPFGDTPPPQATDTHECPRYVRNRTIARVVHKRAVVLMHPMFAATSSHASSQRVLEQRHYRTVLSSWQPMRV